MMIDLLPITLAIPAQTLSGEGTIDQIIPLARAFGPRGMLVCGRSLERSGTLGRILATTRDDRAVAVWRHPGGEPTLDQLEALLAAARGHDAGWIAGVGGGSVLDLAKAGAGLLEAPLPVLAYHDGASIPPSRIPFLAAPTTAGTGSEATSVSVLTQAAKSLKKSIRHPSFMARQVILDPDLLAPCPPRILAHAGMDALTQAIESFGSRGATWWTDVMVIKAMELLVTALPRVFEGGTAADRRDLLTGSYLAGLALANARLGVVHGLAHPLGAHFHQPHGLVCAVCLPAALAFNREAIGAKRSALNAALGGAVETVVANLIQRLDIVSPFNDCDLSPDLESTMIDEVLASGSTQANPRTVTASDARYLLHTILTPPPPP